MRELRWTPACTCAATSLHSAAGPLSPMRRGFAADLERSPSCRQRCAHPSRPSGPRMRPSACRICPLHLCIRNPKPFVSAGTAPKPYAPERSAARRLSLAPHRQGQTNLEGRGGAAHTLISWARNGCHRGVARYRSESTSSRLTIHDIFVSNGMTGGTILGAVAAPQPESNTRATNVAGACTTRPLKTIKIGVNTPIDRMIARHLFGACACCTSRAAAILAAVWIFTILQSKGRFELANQLSPHDSRLESMQEWCWKNPKIRSSPIFTQTGRGRRCRLNSSTCSGGISSSRLCGRQSVCPVDVCEHLSKD